MAILYVNYILQSSIFISFSTLKKFCFAMYSIADVLVFGIIIIFVMYVNGCELMHNKSVIYFQYLTGDPGFPGGRGTNLLS